jgi:hypothetical protein
MPIGLRCRRAGQTAFSLFKFARALPTAPIIQCRNEIVKGFLRPEVNQCEFA